MNDGSLNMPPLRGLRLIVCCSTKIPLLTELAGEWNMKQHGCEMIWWSVEDDAHIVDAPELPGGMAHGATRQAAKHVPRLPGILRLDREWMKLMRSPCLDLIRKVSPAA